MYFLEHAWSLVWYVIPFIFILSIVVFFHELGHFMVGRWCGVKVDAFSLGFGPELFAFVDRRGTRWRVAALPLGGYVKFHGDANAASAAARDPTVKLSEEERRISFFTQPVWKRAAIVAAGPIANFILAVVIFSGVFYTHGRGVLAPRIEGIRAGEVAEAAGFQAGDLIVSIDGKAIDSWGDMQRTVQASPDVPLTFVVQRGARDVTINVTPKLRVLKTPFGETKVGLIGLNATSNPDDWRIQSYGLIDSVGIAVSETWYVSERTVNYIGGLFMGRESANQISGPIGTGYIAGEVAKAGFVALLNLAAILSISIGLINLFPIPLLDGGHLLYYIFEAIKGKPLSERVQELGFRFGLAFVVALMLFATFNDILHLSGG